MSLHFRVSSSEHGYSSHVFSTTILSIYYVTSWYKHWTQKEIDLVPVPGVHISKAEVKCDKTDMYKLIYEYKEGKEHDNYKGY